MTEQAMSIAPGRLWPSFYAGIGCLVASSMVAAFLSVRSGLGMGDIPAFVLWTLPFAVVVSALQAVLATRLRGLPTWATWFSLIVFGPVVAVAWTYVVGSILGPWFQTFSIPVLFCWLAGALAGLSVGPTAGGQLRTTEGLVACTVGVLACALLGMKSEELFASVVGDQRLEVVILKAEDASQPLGLDSSGEALLGGEGVEQLRAAGVTGRLKLSSAGTYGRGRKSARVVVVLQGGLQESVDLRQPDQRNVIYFQHDGVWRMYPPDAPTLARSILLRSASEARPGSYQVELVDRSRQGGGL